MTIEVRVPQLPESVADATLVAWHKKPGDAVSRDENLVDLETDKVVLEVPAPAAGVIRELKVQNGAVVTSGQVLALLDEGAAAGASTPAAATAPAAPTQPAPAADAKTGGSAEKLAPSVRRLVEEHKLEPGAIPGSGRDGRITKGDVLSHLGSKGGWSRGCRRDSGATCCAGECSGRRPWRAQGPDDAPAGAHCGATRAGPGDRRHADDVQ